MRNKNTLRSTLLAALLILGSVSALAWDSEIKTDTIGPTVYISLADLPALLSGNIVGITLDQMDTLTVDMINLDAARDSMKVCSTELDTALMEVYKRDLIIIDFKTQADVRDEENKFKEDLIIGLSFRIDELEKDLKKQKRKTDLGWLFTGLGTGLGVAFGIWISN